MQGKLSNSTDEKNCACHPVLIAKGDNKEIFQVPTFWMLPLPYTAVLRHPHNAILQ